MGRAIAGGLAASGWADPGEIHVVDPQSTQRDAVEAETPGISVGSAPVAAKGTVLAVKPHLINSVIPTVVDAGCDLLLSIAAGVTLSSMAEAGGPGVTVLRSMPNTPSLARAGTSALCAPKGTDDAHIEWAKELLGAVGAVYVVEEAQIDAVTAVSGSGPGYLFMVAEAMIEGAVLSGLPRDLAVGLVNSTIRGSGELLVQSDRTAADLRAAVTSPGGTTATGLAALEQAGLRSGFLSAIAAAKQRSEELS